MTLHSDAALVLSGWQPPSPDQAQLRDRFVDHLARHPDGLCRACFPAHITASALVLSEDRAEVLLTLHAKARQWFQFGGHTEATDPTLLAAAQREAVEESGLAELHWLPDPVHLDAHEVAFCHSDGPVDHLDVRYLAFAPRVATPRRSAESEQVRWWPVDALPTDEPSIAELVALALRA